METNKQTEKLEKATKYIKVLLVPVLDEKMNLIKLRKNTSPSSD